VDVFDEIKGGEDRLIGLELCPAEKCCGVATFHSIDESGAFETADIEGGDADQIVGLVDDNMSGLSFFLYWFEFGSGDNALETQKPSHCQQIT